MEDTHSVATLIESTTTKIQQLQKAFAELESHRAVTLNMKWQQLEEHFHGLEKSLKRRFNDLEGQEKEYKNKTIRAREILVKREADIIAKEQASLNRLQEKRDAAVSAISSKTLAKHKKPCIEPTSVTTENQCSIPLVEEKPPDVMASEDNSKIVKMFPQNVNVEVQSYPQLVRLCQANDSEGLHKFISENRKNLAAIKEEIPIALSAAADPANLVLDSLQGFYSIQVAHLDGKKDSYLLERAKAIAEEWKPKLVDLDLDASNGNSLEAHAFLQLIATFGINSDYDPEVLSRMIPMVSRRQQTADLCRSLGLSERMPGVIDVLVNNGRQIDAVNLAFSFELTEKYSPVSLLKSYLTEVRKATSPVKYANATPTVQTEVNERELTALKAVIKCIEDHKLEEQYPIDPLQKQVLQLEKAKADGKRATEVAKPQPKRPRANVTGYVPRVTNVAAERNFYPRMTDRYPQYMYERPYAYTGPTDNHIPSLLGSATYNLSPAHGNYFGNGYQYQAPYLH
ncbi:hypothetical protein POM88_052946 [Heracleum sosnowskyi]|uniref:FRIGIDA-like protein n=1 Tax=Heracleum sosnowskyi TaxID=360622 RepID=A0AAD8GR87_9APIA|nr:hypothetical protein POM88_052946 [Heracleum sosnowskyi]